MQDDITDGANWLIVEGIADVGAYIGGIINILISSASLILGIITSFQF